jgi:hypothetical protein
MAAAAATVDVLDMSEASADAHDCPLTASVDAVRASVPPRLRRLQALDTSIDAERVWTTLCCIAVLQRVNASWIWGDGCAMRLRDARGGLRADAAVVFIASAL